MSLKDWAITFACIAAGSLFTLLWVSALLSLISDYRGNKK